VNSPKHVAVHPFLIALYVVLEPLSENYFQVGLPGLRALLFSVIGAIAIILVSKIIVKDWLNAALISTITIFMISLFGQISSLSTSLNENKIAYSIPLGFVFVFLFFVFVYWVTKKSKITKYLSNFFNIFCVVLLIFPLFRIINYSRMESNADYYVKKYIRNLKEIVIPIEVKISDVKNFNDIPDIYYIVLDAYTRDDVLQELYDYDNSKFIRKIEDYGFYIAKRSRANYSDTELSISSSLNLIHVNNMPIFYRQNADMGWEWLYRNTSKRLIQENKVVELLKSIGYEIVSFDSGFNATRLRNADHYEFSSAIEDAGTTQVMFEMMLLDSFIGSMYSKFRYEVGSPLSKMFQAHRQRVIYSLEHLDDFADRDGDYFIFAHIVSPHTPYVFGPNGEMVQVDQPYTLMDYHPGQKENIKLYRNQVNYLNSLIINTIENILRNSDTPPIIILQSDHGSKVYRELNPPEDIRDKLCYPILNAYFFPGIKSEVLYPTITPVNSFRVLFNTYFGSDLELQSDVSYRLMEINGRFEFIEACASQFDCLD
jgi:hypothetical protein